MYYIVYSGKIVGIMKHRYIVTGATGKIGTFFTKIVGRRNCVAIAKRRTGPNILNIDLSCWDGRLKQNVSKFDTVVHLAASAHIDRCEVDKKKGKVGETWVNNVISTEKIVDFCRKNNKKLIYLSTECVFDGLKKEYIESDKPNPINWYGVTKLESEKIVMTLPGSLIIRTSMAYDGQSENYDIVGMFASLLMQNKKILAAQDQLVSFTYTGDIVKAIIAATEKNLTGIYHFSGKDKLTIYELVLKICNILNKAPGVVVPSTMERILGSSKARLRLKNSVLCPDLFIFETGVKPNNIDNGLMLSLTGKEYIIR